MFMILGKSLHHQMVLGPPNDFALMPHPPFPTPLRFRFAPSIRLSDGPASLRRAGVGRAFFDDANTPIAAFVKSSEPAMVNHWRGRHQTVKFVSKILDVHIEFPDECFC